MVFTNRLGPISKLDYRAKTHRGGDVKRPAEQICQASTPRGQDLTSNSHDWWNGIDKTRDSEGLAVAEEYMSLLWNRNSLLYLWLISELWMTQMSTDKSPIPSQLCPTSNLTKLHLETLSDRT